MCDYRLFSLSVVLLFGCSSKSSDSDNAPGLPGNNSCTLSVSGDSASGVGVVTLTASNVIAKLQPGGNIIEVSCAALMTDSGVGQAVFDMGLPPSVTAPVSMSFPPFTANIPETITTTVGGLASEYLPNGIIHIGAGANIGNWVCAYTPVDGGGVVYGTLNATVSYLHALSPDPLGVTNYRVQATAHGACVDESGDKPGTLTVDVTMR